MTTYSSLHNAKNSELLSLEERGTVGAMAKRNNCHAYKEEVERIQLVILLVVSTEKKKQVLSYLAYLFTLW